MNKITYYRLIRMKYNIKLSEIAALTNVSGQRISQIERGNSGYAIRNKEELIRALEKLIEEKKQTINNVTPCIKEYRDRLFDYVESKEIFNE